MKFRLGVLGYYVRAWGCEGVIGGGGAGINIRRTPPDD